MNFRTKLLKKIAQNATNQMTTDEVNKTKSVAGSPRSFVASNSYPTIITGLTSKNVPLVNGLSNVLNNALYYTSNGQVDLHTLKDRNFNLDTSQIPSHDLMNIANFCKAVYQNLYTNLGYNYTQPLSSELISVRVNTLNNHSALNNLPQAAGSGQLTAKLGGDLKTIIKNYLLQIK